MPTLYRQEIKVGALRLFQMLRSTRSLPFPMATYVVATREHSAKGGIDAPLIISRQLRYTCTAVVGPASKRAAFRGWGWKLIRDDTARSVPYMALLELHCQGLIHISFRPLKQIRPSLSAINLTTTIYKPHKEVNSLSLRGDAF